MKNTTEQKVDIMNKSSIDDYIRFFSEHNTLVESAIQKTNNLLEAVNRKKCENVINESLIKEIVSEAVKRVWSGNEKPQLKFQVMYVKGERI